MNDYLLIEEIKNSIPIHIKRVIDLGGKSQFIMFYISETPATFEACKLLAENWNSAFSIENKKFLLFYLPQPDASGIIGEVPDFWGINISLTEDDIYIEGGMFDERTSLKDLLFTKRIYIYHETSLRKEQKKEIEKLFNKKKFSLFLRDNGYAYDRNHRDYKDL